MMRFMKATTLIFLVFLPFAALQAQNDIGEEEQEIRRYSVEMIIFKYAQEVEPGSEIFPADRPPVIDTPVLDDEPLLQEEPLEETERRLRNIELVRLTQSEFTMNEIMERLRRLDVYEPVMHFGWTQTTWPQGETRDIDLGSMGRLPSGLGGTLKLYLSRYLHLVVDLQLDAPESANVVPGRDDPRSGYGDYRTLNAMGEIDEPGPVRYRINENRIFRSGELRYFDHPKFGVLARVTRVEEQEQEPGEPDATELLGYPAQ
jgi:hypothetical protein